MEKIEQSSKILRNCRKIEHRIHQLQKQLYLGHTTAYNIIMEILHPNYKEHSENLRNKHLNSKPLHDDKSLDKIEEKVHDE